MYKLTLEWVEGNVTRFETISLQQPTKARGIIRIGRDPSLCDVVIQDPTNKVSRLHIEIFVNSDLHTLYLRNATGHHELPNVVFLDGKLVLDEEFAIQTDSVIQLRDIKLYVAEIEKIESEINLYIITPDPVNQGDIKLKSTILQQAIKNDFDAIVAMFKQFIPEDEQVHFAQYLGLQGLWGIGTHQFACVTERRVADLRVGRFGKIIYQDGYLEHINSGVSYQPSKLGLYLLVGLLAVALIVLSQALYQNLWGLWLLLLLPFIVKLYYRGLKCGLVFSVKESEVIVTNIVNYAFSHRLIYIFTNPKLFTRVNALYRSFIICREERLNLVTKYPILNLEENQLSSQLTSLSLSSLPARTIKENVATKILIGLGLCVIGLAGILGIKNISIPYVQKQIAIIYYNEGNSLDAAKSYQSALLAYNNAIDIKPDYYEALKKRGDSLHKLQQYEEALVAYNQALEIRPNYSAAFYHQGLVLKDLGLFEPAIAAFDHAIQGDGNFDEFSITHAWIQKCSALNKITRHHVALAACEQAINIESNQGLAWYLKGETLLSLESYQEAVNAYDTALGLEPNASFAHLALNDKGVALYYLKRYEEALFSFDKAIVMKPDYQRAINNKQGLVKALGK